MKRSIGPKTLLQPTPVLIIGTYDADDRANMMNVAWGGICCSRPPCLNISLRKATYSYGAIVRHQAFTVNIPSVSQMREADYAGIYSGRDGDKFAATGLTPVPSDLVHAPYIAEFPLIFECKVIHTLEIGLHTLFVGEILDAKADEEVLKADGLPDLGKVRPFVFEPGGRGYYAVGARLADAFSIGRRPPTEM